MNLEIKGTYSGIASLFVASEHESMNIKSTLHLWLIVAFILCLPITAFADARKLVEVRLYDYGWEADIAILDLLANELRNEPNAKGYVILYGGRQGRGGEIQVRMSCMRSYMLNNFGLRAERFIISHGGFRENATMELWVVPEGGCPPIPSPTVSPEDVRFIRGRPRYSCEI
jgi:hypothetical protein